jgi:hypothetical protein
VATSKRCSTVTATPTLTWAAAGRRGRVAPPVRIMGAQQEGRGPPVLALRVRLLNRRGRLVERLRFGPLDKAGSASAMIRSSI